MRIICAGDQAPQAAGFVMTSERKRVTTGR